MVGRPSVERLCGVRRPSQSGVLGRETRAQWRGPSQSAVYGEQCNCSLEVRWETRQAFSCW